MAPALSIIIPTHKRAAILRQCLEHIDAQTVSDKLEVIIVSDGPDEETAALIRSRHTRTSNQQPATSNPLPNSESRIPHSVPVSYFEIPKQQQGAARNLAVIHAKANLSLIIGDDIFLAPDACEKHLAVHEKLQKAGLTPAAVLGFVTWDPALTITPVMRWLEQSGWQFGYPKIQIHAHGMLPSDIQHLFTYTSHLSVPTEILRSHPFREDMTLYGWEDIEWGMRLRDSDVRLSYEPDAKAFHHHVLSLENSLERMMILGQSAARIQKISPQLGRVPRGWKLLAYKIIALFPTLRGIHSKAFLRGIETEEHSQT